VKFPATGLAAGAYYLTASVDTANAFAESNEANNKAVSGTTFTVA
jgi:subtilase family serine protease